MQATDRPALMPSEGVLALHDLRRRYGSFEEFQPDLLALLQQAALLDDCTTVTWPWGFSSRSVVSTSLRKRSTSRGRTTANH